MNGKETRATRARYGRIAPIYDCLEFLPELRYRPWRKRFWDLVAENLPPQSAVLEVGIGTGVNIPYWTSEHRYTGIDLTPGMLKRARKRAVQIGVNAEILDGDAQDLKFTDDLFDAAVATFVFCSVPDPILGLRELKRVVKPGGSILLMEHVRSKNPRVARWMDRINPIVRAIMGPNINRETVENVQRSGLILTDVMDLDRGGIFKIIHGQVPSP